jgi:hypothetical protein
VALVGVGEARTVKRRWLVGLVVVVAALAAVALLVTQPWAADEAVAPTTLDPADPTDPSDPTDPADPTDPEGPHLEVEVSAPMPLAVRYEPAVVLAGDQLVVWGGRGSLGRVDEVVRVFSDGAVLDLESDAWRVMSEAPFPEVPDRLPETVMPPRAAVVDSGVVIVRDEVTGLWDPATDTWRLLDSAPGQVGPLWSDGTSVFSAAANARLDVASGRWESLPDPPVALGDPVSAWTGDQLVVVGLVRYERPAALAFDPSSAAWRRLPEVPAERSRADLSMGWDGERALLYDDLSSRVVAYDPVLDRWEELPPTLARRLTFHPVTFDRVGDSPLLFMRDVMMLLDGDLWRPVPYGGVAGNPIVAGDVVAAVKGIADSTVLVLAKPAGSDQVVVLTVDVLDVLRQRVVVVGPISIEVPEPYSVYRLTSAPDQPFTVYLERNEETCSIMAGEIDQMVESIGPEVVLDHGGDERVWTRGAAGQNWQHIGVELSVAIWCADPEVSAQVAASVRVE